MRTPVAMKVSAAPMIRVSSITPIVWRYIRQRITTITPGGMLNCGLHPAQCRPLQTANMGASYGQSRSGAGPMSGEPPARPLGSGLPATLRPGPNGQAQPGHREPVVYCAQFLMVFRAVDFPRKKGGVVLLQGSEQTFDCLLHRALLPFIPAFHCAS